ncbi:MAG TPA: helix-turn-helix domain-containing GNAT family N-acetyltransferase [Vicinamibacteria bacterium]|nr:helix-turn-helix domain-containing GNAT family N-acetyltransferase [Vicinamibacteria bacterium]
MDDSLRVRRVEAVRRFGRFYTRRIGALREGLLESPFSLTEARVIYELAHKETATASELSEELGVDAGYLSRILRSFGKRGLVQRKPDANDGRQFHLWLSERGQEAFARLNAASSREIDGMLSELSERDQARLVEAMGTIETLLGTSPPRHAPYLLRPHQPGDMGWVVQRHGTLYAQEYGWDETFEALVAGIVAKFIENFDARRERCWIAEKDGENVGSAFVVKHTKTVAKLRLLLVEPRARGLGIGRRLVDECVRFARARGYKKMTLWTNDVLHAARHIYEAVGFELVGEEKHESFGHDLVGQTWDKKL